jgi:hypothetical protein
MESMETLNIHGEQPSHSSDDDEGEGLDDPSLYFGEVAKDKFWDFYKSDRKFKDFNVKR